VAPRQDLIITCKSGVTIRMPVSGISEQGRATQGVKLIRVDEGDEIAAITKLDDEQQVTGPLENGISNEEQATDSPVNPSE
jgi:DNA gyrase subunit A